MFSVVFWETPKGQDSAVTRSLTLFGHISSYLLRDCLLDSSTIALRIMRTILKFNRSALSALSLMNLEEFRIENPVRTFPKIFGMIFFSFFRGFWGVQRAGIFQYDFPRALGSYLEVVMVAVALQPCGCIFQRSYVHGNLRYPPQCHPPNK